MSVFLRECSNFWGSKISSGRLGGDGGSDVHVQLTLSGEIVNMWTAPKKRKTRKAVLRDIYETNKR